MLGPLVVLAILSVVGGWIGIPAALGGPNHFEHFLDPVFASTAALHGAAALNSAAAPLDADQVSHASSSPSPPSPSSSPSLGLAVA